MSTCVSLLPRFPRACRPACLWRRSPLTPLHVVRCQGDVTVFRRRVYSKYPKPKGDVQDYVLVHYLREKIQTKAPGVQGRSKHGRNALSKGVPSQGSAWPLSIVEYSPNWDTCRGGAKV